MFFDRLLGRTARPSFRDAMARVEEPLFEELERREMLAADLGITGVALTTAGPFTPASNVAVQLVYRNTGTELFTGNATFRAVLSLNNTYGDADDIELFPSGAANPALALPPPGLSTFRNSATVPMPAGIDPGVYYLIARLDTSGLTPGDTNAANNTFVGTTRITINAAAPAPDLTVSATVTGGTFAPGAVVSGTVSLTNSTATTPGAVTIPIRYFLSTDAVFGNADDVQITPTTGGDFNGAPTGTTNQALSFTLPGGIANGTYRIIAVADPNLAVGETNEANNTFISGVANIIVSRPDPVVSFAPTTTSIRAGGTIFGTLTVRNLGNIPVNPFDIGVAIDNGVQTFIIQNAVVGGPDQPVPGAPALTAGQIRTFANYPIPVPATIPPGTYRVFMLADASNTISEGTVGENNNEVGPFGTITILAPLAPVTTADLVIHATFPAATVSPGGAYFFSGALSNVGTQAAATGSVSVFLSTNATLGDADDILVDNNFAESTNLPIGSAWSELLAVPIPNTVPAGLYYVFFSVDPANALDEGAAGEANNITRSATPVLTVTRPNLVGTIAGPATVAAGAFITPTITVRNAGSATAAASNYTIAIRPAAAVDNSQDIVIATGSVGSLTAGAIAAPVLQPIAIPTSIAAGPYRLVINVDTTDTVSEGGANENNTFLAATNTTVTNPGTATLPDLVASVLPVTATVVPGGTLNVSARVSNTGAAPATNFTVRVFLSTNGTLDGSDIQIDSFDVAALATPTQQFDRAITLPSYLLGGAFFVIVRADDTDAVAESNENNNNGATAAATVSVLRPTVSIAATDPAAAETNVGQIANPGSFTVTRTGPTTLPLVVNYTIGGTATSVDDFAALSGSVTIPAGQVSAVIAVTPVNDSTGEPAETVIATLARGTGYSINLAVNRATVTIADNEPTVTIAATDPIGTETGIGQTADGIRFTFTRTGPTTDPLDVTYSIGGTADGSDTTGLTGTITIPAGQLSAVLNAAVVDDVLGESPETVILTIVSGNGYAAGAIPSATATINDNEPIVTVLAIDPAAAQTRVGEVANRGQVRFTRTGSTAAPLTVNYTIGGTGVNGTDYQDADTTLALSGQITIPAGQTTALLNIAPLIEPRTSVATVVVTVDPFNGAPYRASNPNTAATVTITPLPPVNLVASQLNFLPATLSLSQPGLSTNFAFTVERNGVPSAPLNGFSVQVRLSNNLIMGDADDIILFTQVYAAGFTGQSTINGTLLWDTLPLVVPGNYNLGLFVDSGSAVSEYNEIDNRLISDSGVLTFTA